MRPRDQLLSVLASPSELLGKLQQCVVPPRGWAAHWFISSQFQSQWLKEKKTKNRTTLWWIIILESDACWFLHSLPQWRTCNLCPVCRTAAPCSHSVFDMFTLCSAVSLSCKEWVFFFFLGFCCCHGSDDNVASWVQLYANEFPRQALYGPILPVQWAQLMHWVRQQARLYKRWEEDWLLKRTVTFGLKLSFKRTADWNRQQGVTLCLSDELYVVNISVFMSHLSVCLKEHRQKSRCIIRLS